MSLFGDSTVFPPATFSVCRRYRWTLWRELPVRPSPLAVDRGYLAVIGLNPSTADETNNDPTIRRCIGFARDWGHSGLFMLNLFAFRATDPADMKREPEPVGDANDAAILNVAKGAGMVLAAWGVHGEHPVNGVPRSHNVQLMLAAAGIDLYCLGITNDGQPRHPLYIKADTLPQLYKRGQL